MISLLKDPSAQLLKSYIPPFKGTWKTLPAHLLPDDVVQDSLNVTLQDGRLRARCGLAVYDTTDLTNRVLGSFMFTGVTSPKHPVVATRNKLFRYLSGAYIDSSGTATLTPVTDTVQIRMTSIQSGSSVYLLYTNDTDVLKFAQESLGLQNIVPYVDPVLGTSSIPICRDICTSFSRIVGITPPYTIQWSAELNSTYLSFTNWPSLNQAILADTEDELVCIGSLGTLGIAVYKEGNIFVGFAQSGPSSQAFRFEHRGEYEGPAGVQARINVNGVHVYMTPTGRIGYFDGTQQSWIADGLWPFLRDTVDIANMSKAFGVYSYKTSEAYFFYPRIGDNGACKGMVILDAPYPRAGVTDTAYFLGSVNFETTNGLGVRLFNANANPLIFALPSSINKTFELRKDTLTDNNSAYTCNFSTGLFKPQINQAFSYTGTKPAFESTDTYRAIYEIYASRDNTKGIVNIKGLVSQLLETDGIETELQEIDLTQEPVSEYVAFNDTGSFLGLKCEWDSTAEFEYKGADVYGRAT